MKSEFITMARAAEADRERETRAGRWGLYIDAEGFSSIYATDKVQALLALGELMEALHRLGSSDFFKCGGRVFIHQFGDGFAVVSEAPAETPEAPLAIALAVMRHLIAKGVAAKAGISKGDFGDIFGWYPAAIQNAAKDHRCVPLAARLACRQFGQHPAYGAGSVSTSRMRFSVWADLAACSRRWVSINWRRRRAAMAAGVLGN